LPAILDVRYGKKAGKRFFFEKKNQKTFAPLRAVRKPPGTETNKVFLAGSIENGKIWARPPAALPRHAGEGRHPRLFHHIHCPCLINTKAYPQISQIYAERSPAKICVNLR
jgi:hypothetical protein